MILFAALKSASIKSVAHSFYMRVNPHCFSSIMQSPNSHHARAMSWQRATEVLVFSFLHGVSPMETDFAEEVLTKKV